jgi:16S rRNA (cytidine1402-2'-O)-methyltransferase
VAGRLFLVATPIGNLADVTERARQTLAAAAFVVCEDTRHSQVLLEHLGIRKELVSLPAFAEGQRAGQILDRIEAGQDAALVTDAGSPGISDPGEKLVARAVERGITAVPIPGPTALIAALSASGLPSGRFHFLGFLPRKGPERRAMIDEVSALASALILYEAPNRVSETLAELHQILGARRACVARELTKMHEELVRGTLAELAARYQSEEPRGEVVIVVEGRTAPVRWTGDEVRHALQRGLAAGERLKELSTEIARASGWSGQDVYKLGLTMRGGGARS